VILVGSPTDPRLTLSPDHIAFHCAEDRDVMPSPKMACVLRVDTAGDKRVSEKDRHNPKAAETIKRFPTLLDHRRLAPITGGLVVAVAMSLPWSTSITGVLIVLWFIALAPTLDAASLRREVMSAPGGLPILLWTLGASGTLWADVSLSERIGGLSGFHKLLFVPLLLAQFRRCGHAKWVILGFFLSSAALLVVSWGLVLVPGLPWRGKEVLGVPVKDYILQSELFAICAFGLIGQAACLWRARPRLALLLVLAAALFIANILYVETARTTLVVVAVLLCLFGLRQFGWKGAFGACAIGIVLAGAGWMTSPHLRWRVLRAIQDVQAYDAKNVNTPVGQRFEYWKKSLKFVARAPVLGHGTGSILQLFQRDATAQTHPAAITANPHNQVLVVALELGIVGSIVLFAMWASQLALFRERTLIAWFGLVVVVQNVVSCLFNSHLFDFTQGWLYVFGVGVIGGTVLHNRDAGERANALSVAPAERHK
jgi:O-antigen ligase